MMLAKVLVVTFIVLIDYPDYETLLLSNIFKSDIICTITGVHNVNKINAGKI